MPWTCQSQGAKSDWSTLPGAFSLVRQVSPGRWVLHEKSDTTCERQKLTRGQPPGPARALLTLIYLHHARLGRPHTEWTDGPPTSLLFPPTAKAATIMCRNRRRPGLTHHFLLSQRRRAGSRSWCRPSGAHAQVRPWSPSCPKQSSVQRTKKSSEAWGCTGHRMHVVTTGILQRAWDFFPASQGD